MWLIRVHIDAVVNFTHNFRFVETKSLFDFDWFIYLCIKFTVSWYIRNNHNWLPLIISIVKILIKGVNTQKHHTVRNEMMSIRNCMKRVQNLLRLVISTKFIVLYIQASERVINTVNLNKSNKLNSNFHDLMLSIAAFLPT